VATNTPLSPRAAIIVGVLCGACGIVPILGGLGLIPIQLTEGTPAWLAVCAGLAFVMAGAAVMVGYALAGGTGPDGDLPPGTPFIVRLVQYVLGLGITGLMTAMAAWVAFGSGPRHFSGTLVTPFISRRWSDGELSGRIAFGIGAVLMLAFLVAMGIVGARRLLGARASAPGPTRRDHSERK
jgi:hypothetical protein